MMNYPLLAPALVSLALCVSGCVKDISVVRNPVRPGKAERHIVELVQVQFDSDDLNESLAGNPLDLTINILQNGEPLRSNSEFNYLKGTRGERILTRPIRWVIDFDPNRNYQIRLEEVSIIAPKSALFIPKTPKLGDWPFARGKISIGTNSYLMFKDTIVEEPPDDYLP